MIIKRYIVNSMNEAMTRIRYELGKDAVIISQRRIKKPGIRGFFSKKVIEVTAAVENIKKNDEPEVKDSIEAIKKVMENASLLKDNKKDNIVQKDKVAAENTEEAEEAGKEEKAEKEESNEPNEIAEQIREMKQMLNVMMTNTAAKAPKKSKFQIKMENCDLSESLIKKLTTKMKNINGDLDEIEKAKLVIKKMISTSRMEMKGTVVFVGPTGVGKTTTIAKLAGRQALVEKKKVGLITIDTYRIGAVEQLKTYAEIMNIPFKVVLTLKDMEAAIESFRDFDTVLVDTTGRSCKNSIQISELRAFIEKAHTDNIQLVVSSTTKQKDIEAIIEGYKLLNFNSVIITKLDETSAYGSILNILDIAQKPISYITTGQNVPDDIKKLTNEEIADIVLGEDCI